VPQYANDFDDLLRLHYFEADIDGAFTDFPDRVVEFLKAVK
jgi:glycerophosphoryl diester phosphodiesterase